MIPTLSTMDPRRRTDVRAMLVARAADTSAQTSPPGGSLRDAHSSAQRRSSARRIGSAVIAVAAVVVTASIILAADPAAPPSYASWSAVPETAPGAPVSDRDLETWASQCTDLGVGGVAVEGVSADPDAAARREVLVDRRGSFTFCVDVSMGAPDDPFIAIAGLKAEGGREDGLSTMWGAVRERSPNRPTGDDILVLAGDLKTPPNPPEEDPDVISLHVYQLFGLAGPGVLGIDVILANGLRVTCSVHNGMWGAWWPSDKGDPTDSELRVHTAAGSHPIDPDTATLPLP